MPQRQPQRIAPEGSPLGPLRVALLPLVFLCWSWAGSPALEPADDLSMMADEPFVFEPSVRAELVFDVPDDAQEASYRAASERMASLRSKLCAVIPFN